MRRTVIFTGAIGIVFFVVERLGFGIVLPIEKWVILAFFLSLYALQHRLLAFGWQGNNKNFVQFYLTSTVLRLLLCAIFFGLFLYFGVKNQQKFAITFIVLYLCYTCFEICEISTKLRRDLKPRCFYETTFPSSVACSSYFIIDHLFLCFCRR